MLDLPTYLKRIGFEGDLTPNAGLLDAIHLAHATRIPFENLDILLGRPIRLDLASIQRKLIHGGRGGYCFEHNLLLAAVLERLGFQVTMLAARVRLGSDQVRARTHMLLMVDLAGQGYLADVGFGARGFLKPLPFQPGQVFQRFQWVYRITEENGAWVLQSREGNDWIDLYAFTLEPNYWIDYKVANHYVSTHPDSQFATGIIVQRPTPEARYSLFNLEYSIDRGTGPETWPLKDPADLLRVLEDIFGLVFPPGTRFQYTPTAI
jgi:N-hydroxyarylamine O-acetyltransferase